MSRTFANDSIHWFKVKIAAVAGGVARSYGSTEAAMGTMLASSASAYIVPRSRSMGSASPPAKRSFTPACLPSSSRRCRRSSGLAGTCSRHIDRLQKRPLGARVSGLLRFDSKEVRLRNEAERLFGVGPRLGTRREPSPPASLTEPLRLAGRNELRSVEIRLVHKEEGGDRARDALDRRSPVDEAPQRLGPGPVADVQDGLAVREVRVLQELAEPEGPHDVPDASADLDPRAGAARVRRAELARRDLRAQRRDVPLVERVRDEPPHQARLADGRIARERDLHRKARNLPVPERVRTSGHPLPPPTGGRISVCSRLSIARFLRERTRCGRPRMRGRVAVPEVPCERRLETLEPVPQAVPFPEDGSPRLFDCPQELGHPPVEVQWRGAPVDEGQEEELAFVDRDLSIVDGHVLQVARTARSSERVADEPGDEREHPGGREIGRASCRERV